MGFPRQEYWSGLPFASSRGSSPPQGSSSHLLHGQADSLLLSYQGSLKKSWLILDKSLHPWDRQSQGNCSRVERFSNHRVCQKHQGYQETPHRAGPHSQSSPFIWSGGALEWVGRSQAMLMYPHSENCSLYANRTWFEFQLEAVNLKWVS